MNHSNLFMLKKDLADLRTTKISYGLASDHVRFIQTYDNLTVYGTETSVHINKDGYIELIHNNYKPQLISILLIKKYQKMIRLAQR